MKTIIFILICLSFIAACSEKPKNPVAEYGDTMINSYQKGKDAGISGNLDAVRNAVRAFHAAHDRYPQNLEEIRNLLGGSDIDLSKYDYNPENGAVALKGT